jgi:hypothetical protein
MHIELVQRLFLAVPGPEHAYLTMFAHTLPARCLVPRAFTRMVRYESAASHTSYSTAQQYLTLRSLREPRVSPEPLAVLEEQDSCEMESLISDQRYFCRATVPGSVVLD